MLRKAGDDPELAPTVAITRLLALTGCRRGEIISLKWSEIEFDNSCLRLSNFKEGTSTQPVGLPVIELLEERRNVVSSEQIFPGMRGSETFGSFPNQWSRIFGGDEIPSFTAHVLRHSFAGTANDLGFTKSTMAARVGHSANSITSKYIHALDSVLIMAADTSAGSIGGLIDGEDYKHAAYALDRASRRAVLNQFLRKAL